MKFHIPNQGKRNSIKIKCSHGEMHTISWTLGGRIRLHDHANIKAAVCIRTMQKSPDIPACILWLLDYRDGCVREEAFGKVDLIHLQELFVYREEVRVRRQMHREGRYSEILHTAPSGYTPEADPLSHTQLGKDIKTHEKLQKLLKGGGL